MSDWLEQFTSSYVSSIAYGITILVLSILAKPIRAWLFKWKRRVSEVRQKKRQNELILPSIQETQRFSTKQKTTETEWDDAIEFLKNDIKLLFPNSSKRVSLAEKVISHFDKHLRVYQFTLGGLAIINLIATILQSKFWQTISQSIIGAVLLFMVLALAFSFLSLMAYIKKEKSRVKEIKNQIHDAINVIAPGVVFTYGQLGELLKTVDEHGLSELQSELSDIGLSFTLDDMRLAKLLSTAPAVELLPIGKRIVSNLEQYASIAPEKKDELAQVFVDALRLWPVRLNK